MVDALDRIGPWLLDAGIAAAAWLSLAMLAMVACRQPILRRDLARVAIVGALALGPLSLLPHGRFGLAGPLTRAFGPIDPATAVEWLRPVDGLARILPVAYLGVALAGIGWMVLGTWAMGRIVRSSCPASEMMATLYDALPFEGHPASRPRLAVSGRVGRPVLIGGRRPTIVIPTGWDRPGPDAAERLRLGLLHELAHAERSDPTFHWLGGLAQALWFAWPPLWWLRRQLRIDQEVLADQRAAGRLGTASATYAASLVAMAAGRTPDAVPNSAGGGLDNKEIDPDGSPLVRRVATLVRCPFRIEPAAPFWWRIGLPPIAAVVLLLATRLSVADRQPATAPCGSCTPPIAFRFAELAVNGDPDARALRLPVPLPDRFELSMLLLVDRGRIDENAVAGFLLGYGAEVRPGVMGTEAWHRILLIVDGPEARLWIDDRPERPTPDPSGCRSWLTIRPAPGGSIRIRELILIPTPSDDGSPDATGRG